MKKESEELIQARNEFSEKLKESAEAREKYYKIYKQEHPDSDPT